mmetsp:Transcript_6264/g.15100  ORF Transcript_6264/g.15100 Transcript_6264/m.15100 type:complete len:594 (-) Transcript_6264:147-1928(-)
MSSSSSSSISSVRLPSPAMSSSSSSTSSVRLPSPFIDDEALFDDEQAKFFRPRLAVEKRIDRMTGQVRGKRDWESKLRDDRIRKKWLREAREQELKDNEISRAFEELDWAATFMDPGTKTSLSAVPTVFQADALISDELHDELKRGLNPLETTEDVDYHPGSQKLAINLIHPSLHCYVRGRSKVTKEKNLDLENREWWFKDLRTVSETKHQSESRRQHSCKRILNSVMGLPRILYASIKRRASGLIASTRQRLVEVVQQALPDGQYSSNRYQWLPSEFEVDESGRVKIKSYIVGAHPHDCRGLYSTLETIFERFIPLFEKTLTTSTMPFPHKTTPCLGVMRDWKDGRTPVVHPPLQRFVRPEMKSVGLRGRRLQVIVKAAKIHLTPSTPVYPGGTWHVEGMRNENIAATGIYYYDQENVSPSTLSFRRAIAPPFYEQNDDEGLRQVFRIEDGQMMNESLGFIECRNRRCITFPNLFQHKVSGFELKDRTKPGHRKILVFFLVHPFEPVFLSTARVRPTDPMWLLEPIDEVLRNVTKLSSGVRRLIFSYNADFGQGMHQEEANVHRLALMKERKFIAAHGTENVFEREFSLCEH